MSTADHAVELHEMYQDISQSRDEIKTKAQLVECTPIFGDEHTIQLDLDSEEAYQFFQVQLRWMQDRIGLPYEYEEWKSRNGNTHVQIKLIRSLKADERILNQCLLGSDIKRELLNYTRLILNGDDMSCLFKPNPKLLTSGDQATK